METKRIIEIARIDSEAESALYALLEEVKHICDQSVARASELYNELVDKVKEYEQ
jgi:hypothetical protein